MSVRIGVEVGGTFTDIVCLDEERQNLGLLEVPTTPEEPNRAVVDGALKICGNLTYHLFRFSS